jgi:threonyl-tRNA synthetase
VVGVPVAEEFADYLGEFIDELRAEGIRAELDDSDDRMPKKIRTHTKSKVPFILIAGEDDRSAGAVSFRFRDGSQKNGVPREEAHALIREAIEQKSHA